jgi:hypothetical protein
MKAIAIPPEAPRMIVLVYDDGQPVDPKVTQWVANRFNELFGNESQDLPTETK